MRALAAITINVCLALTLFAGTPEHWRGSDNCPIAFSYPQRWKVHVLKPYPKDLCRVVIDPPSWKRTVAASEFASPDDHAISIHVFKSDTFEDAARASGLGRDEIGWFVAMGRSGGAALPITTKHAKGFRFTVGSRLEDRRTGDLGGITDLPKAMLFRDGRAVFVEGTFLADGSGVREDGSNSSFELVVNSLAFQRGSR